MINAENNFEQLMNTEIIKTTIQYLPWPLTVILALILFRKSIKNLLNNMKLLKAGSLEFEFREKLLNQGFTDEQLKVVRSLNAQEIDIFLVASYSDDDTYSYTFGQHLIPPIDFDTVLERLDSAGLIKIVHKSDNGIRHVTTKIGSRVRTLLINGTIDLLHSGKS